MSSGNKNYIESSGNPDDTSVTVAFKGLKDDLDEQDENDVGKEHNTLLSRPSDFSVSGYINKLE
jgi:hypothetical protein